MAPLHTNNFKLQKSFLTTGLILLLVGMGFGIVGGLQYILPGFLKEHLSFEKVRPLHVSSVVFWIIIASMGTVLAYITQHTGIKLKYPRLQKFLFPLLISSIVIILISYVYGVFGGREYWEFHPALSLPIILCWILFLVLFSGSLSTMKRQPVYVWMWLTGIIFFLFTFLESYLWLLPYFRNHVINDMTIQWKSYGSMVGAWNMLIYGSSIFLMDKISGDNKYGHSRIAFLLYFTGLFNLMFNWGHHIYTLPTHNYVQYISYAVSMTELIIIGRIIYLWKSSLSTALKFFHNTSYKFLVAADVWVFLTLALAILMSIPAINIYTHGTHVTVAHTMGATIGINTMLLLAFVHDIIPRPAVMNKFNFNSGFWITNISLLVFWVSLIVAGILKSKWQMSLNREAFGTMMLQLRPVFTVFLVSGIALFAGLFMIIVPVIKLQFNKIVILIQHKIKFT